MKKKYTPRFAVAHALSSVLAATSVPALAQVLPTGFRPIAGTVGVSRPNAATLNIQQDSQRAIAQWDSFSIGAGASVNIAQPGASSVLLNRVVGTDLSTIAGTLRANGQVFLVNPNGVLFGRKSAVDVGGLVASTLDIGNASFMAGGPLVLEGSAGGSAPVVNAGRITAAPGGTVALVGAQVRNDGTIDAPGGTAALVAGRKVAMDFDGDGLTTFRIAADSLASVASAENGAGAVISADGGRVAMLADAATVGQRVVNQQGTLRARTLAQRNGEIVLGGGATNDVYVAGTLDATGSAAGQRGGRIDIASNRILVGGSDSDSSNGMEASGTLLDASGAAGGGDIRVHAGDIAVLTPNSLLRADATADGAGGRVVALGDQGLRAQGVLSARGAGNGGGSHGGFVETSGGALDISGVRVDTQAPFGSAGQWVIDPFNLTIAHLAAGAPLPPGALGAPFTAVADATVYDRDINTALATTNVTLNTGARAAVSDASDFDGDISFGTGVRILYTGAAARTLRLEANRSITSFLADAPVIQSTNGALNVQFIADANRIDYVQRDGADAPTGATTRLGGQIVFNGTIATNGGSVQMWATAADGDFLNASLAGTGVQLTGGSITTNGGSVTIFGQGRDWYYDPGPSLARFVDPEPIRSLFGVELDNFSISSGSGAISLRGQGLTAVGYPGTLAPQTVGGVILRNGASLASASGSIEVSGSTVSAQALPGVIVTASPTAAIDPASQARITTTSGDVTLRADSLASVDAIDIAGPVASQSGRINVRAGAPFVSGVPFTTGVSDTSAQQLTLGGAAGAGVGFVVDQDEFAFLSAPSVSVGAGAFSGFSGNIVVAGPIAGQDLTLETNGGTISVNGAITANTLALLAGGSVGQTAPVTATNLVARSLNGDVVLTNAGNQVGTLSGSAVNGTFDFANAGALTIGQILYRDSQGNPSFGTGVYGGLGTRVAAGGNLSTTQQVFGGGYAVLQSAGDIALGADVIVDDGAAALLAGGSISQTAGAITATGLIATAAAGNVALTAEGNAVGTVAGSAAGRFDYLDAQALTIGDVTLADPRVPFGASGITASEVRVRTAGGDLTAAAGVTAAQSLLLQAGPGSAGGQEGAVGPGSVRVDAPLQGTDVALIAAASVTQSGPGGIAAGSLQATAAGGDVALPSTQNNVGVVAGNAAGRFDMRNAGALTVGNVTSTDALQPVASSGIVAGTSARVETLAGGLTVAAPVTAGGNVVLQTLGAGGNLQLDAPVAAAGVVLDATGSVAQSAGGTVTATQLLARAATGDVLLANPANRVGTVAGSAPGRFDYADADALTVGSVALTDRDDTFTGAGAAADTVRVRTFADDLTVTAPIASREADLIAAARFQNVGGIGAPATGDWRVWAATWEGETRGGLLGSGLYPNLYNCSYGGACGVNVPAGSDHFIYTQQPTLNVTVASASRQAGAANPPLGYTVAGFILGDTGVGVTGTVTTAATPSSPPGTYAVTGSFTSAEGYAVNVIPGQLFIDSLPVLPIPDVVRELPTTWLYDRNIGAAPMCFATGPLDGDRARQGGDVLAREWSRVRSRPNLTNCVDTERRNGCADF